MGNGDLNHSGLAKFVEEFAKTEFTQPIEACKI